MSAFLQVFCLFTLMLFGSSSALAAIYGSDNRQDLFEVPGYSKVAAAVAVAFPAEFSEINPDGSVKLTLTEELAGAMCTGEKFAQQTSVGNCSGFLIGDRYLMTAGHCALPNGIIDNEFHPFCEAFSWYFDYNLKSASAMTPKALTENIPADRIYKCKNVIHAENIEGHRDFALIELDRPVVGATPLKIASQEPAVGDAVYTLGHPFGLPAKFSGFAKVSATTTAMAGANAFQVSLDTQSGNSGGVVLNARDEVVGILVSGHAVDLVDDLIQKCSRWNVCPADPATGLCQEESKFAQLERTNSVQKILPLMKYLPATFIGM